MTHNVLIVDDSQDDQLSHRRALSDIDCEVKVAPTIAAGLALAAESRFDTILLDYNLPDGNGLEFMASLKAAHPAGAPPVIMLTGSGNESVAAEAIKAGAYDYLIKTVDGRHCKLLPIVVQRVMREHALRLEKQEAERQLELAAAALSRSNEALRRSNEELQHFAHMAAHDLQAPLNAISGCTQIILEECAGKLSEQGERCMGFILDSTRRMHTLIQDLLSYARLDSQGRSFELANLRKVFDEVRFILATPISQANAEVSCDDLPIVKVDRQQISQLLTNLIQNGIKYNREAIPRVRVSATRENKEWVFAVEDNGIGIDPKYHDQIFEIFRRLHSSSAYPGSGIGLAICRRIVNRHGGRIWVSSQEDNGSVFYFTLPADSPEQD